MSSFINLFLLLFLSTCSANLNVYLTKSETRKVFGLNAELFYVREGILNEYALNFVVPIAANLSELFFTWQGLSKKPMPYLAQVEYDNGDAMALPTLNISTKGIVPTNISTFSVTLPCSGATDAEVNVNLHLNVSSASNSTQFTIRRKKICLKGDPFNLPRNSSVVQHQQPTLVRTPMVTLYIAVVIAFTSTILIITLATLAYLKIKKSKESQALNCRYYSSQSYMGVESSHSSKARNNSYAAVVSHASKCPPTQKNEIVGYTGLVSSPLSNLYNSEASQSLLLNSRNSASSWCSPSSLHSQNLWKDPRQNDPAERIRQLNVDRWQVVVGDLVQEGTFGRVHQGICHDPFTQKALNVIIKTISGDSSAAQAQLVLREGLLLSGLHHPNLLSVLGVCTQDIQRPLLLYPQEEQTNLKLYLRGGCCRGVTLEGRKLLTRDAVQIAIDICHGLIHLHSKKILHKDVAGRNCVVNKDLQVKITDTALARDLFPQDYHCLGDNENRPIKWLSFEAVLYNRFSTASDVWMFGVVLWELMTGAQQPYIEIDPFEMAVYLRDGYRLSQPHNCPDDLFGLMAICWAPSTEDRPSLASLATCLQEFHKTLNTFV